MAILVLSFTWSRTNRTSEVAFAKCASCVSLNVNAILCVCRFCVCRFCVTPYDTGLKSFLAKLKVISTYTDNQQVMKQSARTRFYCLIFSTIRIWATKIRNRYMYIKYSFLVLFFIISVVLFCLTFQKPKKKDLQNNGTTNLPVYMSYTICYSFLAFSKYAK